MGRRRKDDGLLGDIFKACYDLFQHVPIWVGPCVAVVSFALFYWVAPSFGVKDGTPGSPIFTGLFHMLAYGVAGVVVLAWVGAEIRKLTSRRLFDTAVDTGHVNDFTWQQFEHLIGEHYRRQGYMAEVVGSPAGDGGVDILLNGHGQTLLVQCKHWKAFKVGVHEVRDLHSVVTSRRVSGGILITSGRFTAEAKAYAAETGIRLVDGTALRRLLHAAQASPARSAPELKPPTPPAPSVAGPTCPRCGKRMVRRTAQSGAYAGSDFWGCPAYPKCKAVRNIPSRATPGGRP